MTLLVRHDTTECEKCHEKDVPVERCDWCGAMLCRDCERHVEPPGCSINCTCDDCWDRVTGHKKPRRAR